MRPSSLPITYRVLLTPPAHIGPLSSHDRCVTTWRCVRCEPGVDMVEGAGGTCGGVCGPERVVCQCGVGGVGWCGIRGGYWDSGGGRGRGGQKWGRGWNVMVGLRGVDAGME